jgi:ATP-binding cassette subfamily B multidrug efflux pump
MPDRMYPPVRHYQRGAAVVKPKNMKGTLRRLLEMTRGHRRGLGWVLLLSALTSVSAIGSPVVIGEAVNRIYARSAAAGMIALLCAFYIGDWLVRFLQQFLMASIGQKLILHIRKTIFGAMQRLPLSYFDRRQHGELMSRLTNDVDNISTTISDSLSQLMTYFFTVTGIFIVMLSKNIPLTLVALASVGLVSLLTFVITRRTRKLFAKQQAILGRLNGQIEESVSGLNIVKAFGREDDMTESFDDTNSQYCAVATRAQIWSGYLMPITNVINNLSYVFIAVISGFMALRGEITVGLVSSFLLYSRQFSRPFVEIANLYNTFQTAVAGAERIFEVLDEQPEPADRPGALPLGAERGHVEFKNVSFGYKPGEPVIRDFSLDIPAGTRVAIVGPTGSGKTTLINLLTRFYDVGSGAILLDGHDLRDYRLRELRSAFGVVLQDTSLFGISVTDNIRYGRPGTPPEKVRAAAAASGADGFISRLPHGYDTVLEQDGAELSQGERQLLTIARAILADPPILILDEATSSVDTVTERKIRSAVLALTRGRTSFMIAHRLSTIVDSDLIVVVEGGRIAERGTHAELMALGGHYAQMYRTQTAGL